MNLGRELLERAGRVPVGLRRALDEDGSRGAALLREVLGDLERIETRVGGEDLAQPIREVARRYLARLRAAIEDLLARRLRNDPGCEEILAGEVLPLSEGLEGICRSLPADSPSLGQNASQEA